MANLVQPVRTLSSTAKFCNVAIYGLNVIFALGNIAMIGLGTWVLVENMSGDIALMFDSDNFRHAAYILVAAGMVVVVLSICGCCSARKGNRGCLLAYFIALMLMFILEIVGGVTALSFYTQGPNDLERVMLLSVQRSFGIGGNENIQDDSTFAWNNVQEQYDCCGVITDKSGPEIYLRSHWWRDQPVISRAKVPLSCCKEGSNGEPANVKHCQGPNTDYSQVYTTGCYDAVLKQADSYTLPLVAVGILNAFLLLISLIVTYCFYRRM